MAKSISALLETLSRAHILPLTESCESVLTDVTFPGTGCWRCLQTMSCCVKWWAAHMDSSFCYQSCTYCRDAPLSLDTHFQGGRAKCYPCGIQEINHIPNHPWAWPACFLSTIGGKCKSCFYSHGSMHNFVLIWALCLLDVLGMLRKG